MLDVRIRRLATALPTAVLGLALAGCTANAPHRIQVEACDVGSDVRACRDHSIEVHDDYLLGFVELDDQGWLWDREQLEALEARLTEEAHAADLLMVVFVHGWKHNAGACDTNVTCFRRVLEGLQRTEAADAELGGRSPRRVVGVYVGWRGLSLDAGPLSNFSFWNRKATARRVGSQAVTEILARLENVRDLDHMTSPDGMSDTRLVVVGHSFGGWVVYSALSQILMERHLDVAADGTVGTVRGFGDMVVLVNPAFEAARYEPLRELTSQRTYFPGQDPLLAILTSEGDQATGVAFPIGRFFSTLGERHRDRYQRQADGRAVGHFMPIVTHELRPEEKLGEPVKYPAGDCGCPYLPDVDLERSIDPRILAAETWDGATVPFGWELHFPGTVLRHLAGDPLNPYLVVLVDDDIVSKHNQIYRPRFVDFLRYFIGINLQPE